MFPVPTSYGAYAPESLKEKQRKDLIDITTRRFFARLVPVIRAHKSQTNLDRIAFHRCMASYRKPK